MQRIFTKLWFKAAFVRALKTICQTAAGVLSASSLFEQVDWKIVVSASLLSGLISMLTSIGGLPEIDPNAVQPENNNSQE